MDEIIRWTQRLVDGIRSGDEEQIKNLVEHYYQRLLCQTKNGIAPRLRHKIDTEGIVQTAFRTFVRRAQLGEFKIESSENLIAMLSVIASRKKMKVIEKLETQKRSGEIASSDIIQWFEHGDPGPDEIAAFNETLQRARVQLPEEGHVVLEYVLAGYTADEICAELKVTDFLVRSVRKTLRKTINAALRDD